MHTPVGGVPVHAAPLPVPLTVQVYIDGAPPAYPNPQAKVTEHVSPTAPSLAHPDKPADAKGAHLTAEAMRVLR